jgi:hypothetical protein
MDINVLREKFNDWRFEETNGKSPYRLIIDKYDFDCQLFDFVEYEVLKNFYETLDYLMDFLNTNGFIRFEYNGDVRRNVFEFINEDHEIFVNFDLYGYEIQSCNDDIEFTVESFIDEIKAIMNTNT